MTQSIPPSSGLYIDAVSPLFTTVPDSATQYLAGGVTAIGATIPPFHGGTFRDGIRGAAALRQLVCSRSDTLLIERVEDFYTAHDTGKLGVYLHAQSLQFIEDDIENLYPLHLLGLRVAQLAYNRGNMLGAGCHEENNAGLTRLGRRAIAKMNDLGIVVDVSHCGESTSLDAIAASTRPVVFSHSGARSVYDHTRNITDEQITAVAATGGLIGAPALSYFVGPRPVRYQDVIKHIVYIANLAGVEHIALGLDYFDGVTPYSTIRQQQQADDEAYRSGMWDEGDFSPAPNSMPEGIETPDRLHALKTGLERHFSHSDVENILYGNWLRVFGACWK